MRRSIGIALPVALLIWSASAKASMFGEELVPLMKMVAGQIEEIHELSETVGLAEDQIKYLQDLNRGIERTVQQIQSLQDIVEHAQGLDPTGIRSIADLNDLLRKAKNTKGEIEDLLGMKLMVADQAIGQSAVQGDTAYKMGQEMIQVGAQLASESQSASPGRASQITAASGSAQMLAQGVELQTLAQIAQLQAVSLELQKSSMERDLISEKGRKAAFQHQLASSLKRSRP